MSYVDHIQESLHKASLETSRFMSAKLRTEARKSGWPAHVASGMHVRYNDGEFTVHSHPEHKNQVLDLEYGTPSTSPTAAIRRFNNRQGEAEHFLIKRTHQHMRSR